MSFLVTFALHLSKIMHRQSLVRVLFFSLLRGLNGRVCCLGASSVQSWPFRRFVSGRRIRLCSVPRASFSWAGLHPWCPCSPSLYLAVGSWFNSLLLCHQSQWYLPGLCWKMPTLRAGLWFPAEGKFIQLPSSALAHTHRVRAPVLLLHQGGLLLVTFVGIEGVFWFSRVSLNSGRGWFNSRRPFRRGTKLKMMTMLTWGYMVIKTYF